MEGAALFIGLFGFLAVGAWVKARNDLAEKERMFEAQKQILDKLGSGAEVREFLESAQGREFFGRLKAPGKRGPTERQVANQTVYGLAIGGVITFFLGLGFVVAANLAVVPELYVPASICGFIGMGMLIASAAARHLSKKWKLEENEAATPPRA